MAFLATHAIPRNCPALPSSPTATKVIEVEPATPVVSSSEEFQKSQATRSNNVTYQRGVENHSFAQGRSNRDIQDGQGNSSVVQGTGNDTSVKGNRDRVRVKGFANQVEIHGDEWNIAVRGDLNSIQGHGPGRDVIILGSGINVTDSSGKLEAKNLRGQACHVWHIPILNKDFVF